QLRPGAARTGATHGASRGCRDRGASPTIRARRPGAGRVAGPAGRRAGPARSPRPGRAGRRTPTTDPPSSRRGRRGRPVRRRDCPTAAPGRTAIKSDRWIRRMAEEHGMIEPFAPGQVREGVISYGLSSFGYDIRVASDFKVFTDVHSVVVDPKAFD